MIGSSEGKDEWISSNFNMRSNKHTLIGVTYNDWKTNVNRKKYQGVKEAVLPFFNMKQKESQKYKLLWWLVSHKLHWCTFQITSIHHRSWRTPEMALPLPATTAEKIRVDEEEGEKAANEVAVAGGGGRGTWKHAAFHVATTIATPAAYAPLPFALSSLGWPLGNFIAFLFVWLPRKCRKEK